MEIESCFLATCDDTTISVTASGKNGLVSCPQYNFSKSGPRLFALLFKSKELVKLVHDRFCAEQISFTFELGKRPVFCIGYRSRPGLLSRVLGLYPFELNTWQLFILVFDSVRRSKT